MFKWWLNPIEISFWTWLNGWSFYSYWPPASRAARSGGWGSCKRLVSSERPQTGAKIGLMAMIVGACRACLLRPTHSCEMWEEETPWVNLSDRGPNLVCHPSNESPHIFQGPLTFWGPGRVVNKCNFSSLPLCHHVAQKLDKSNIQIIVIQGLAKTEARGLGFQPHFFSNIKMPERIKLVCET